VNIQSLNFDLFNSLISVTRRQFKCSAPKSRHLCEFGQFKPVRALVFQINTAPLRRYNLQLLTSIYNFLDYLIKIINSSNIPTISSVPVSYYVDFIDFFRVNSLENVLAQLELENFKDLHLNIL